MTDFLVEIGTEELPPKDLEYLAKEFARLVKDGFASHSLSCTKAQFFATPRRLAVSLNNLDKQAPSKDVTVWGPPSKIAFDASGNPTAAAKAFASKNNILIEALGNKIENDGVQDKLCHRTNQPGGETVELAGSIIESALSALPISKKMRWGTNTYEFARPTHWILILYGNQTIKATIMGLVSSNTTQGHRFHSDGPIPIFTPDTYLDSLYKAYVMAEFEARKLKIKAAVISEANSVTGKAVIDDSLLREVTALVEWPVALLGTFDERFLALPKEALITSMQEHQKYFPVENKTGELLPFFITISNIKSSNPEQVISGNERVIRPRLADTVFFYDADKKTTLENKRDALKSVVFQKNLGSLYDKTERLSGLAEFLSPLVGAEVALSKRAAKLCKSDLVSEMVGEFASLQGVMGRYYAINDEEHPEVAEAVFEHYMPRYSGDLIPQTATGTTIALADRLDTLVGIFAIGQAPSGSRDPFALRRASLGLLRIIVEGKLELNLHDALHVAALQYGSFFVDLAAAEDTCQQVLTYILERFVARYADEKILIEVYQSVASRKLNSPFDIDQRVQAVHKFTALPEAASLAAANKRVSNILAKHADTVLPKQVNVSLLAEPAEIALAELLEELEKKIHPLLQEKCYEDALRLLSNLEHPVDNFFDDVMVMVDDHDIRNNRLTLLRQLRRLFLEVADISLLAPSKQ
tara:strand:- start:2569 stop:4662 length:2094 start_codon:yes stop_codon:yes gene_type:complete